MLDKSPSYQLLHILVHIIVIVEKSVPIASDLIIHTCLCIGPLITANQGDASGPGPRLYPEGPRRQSDCGTVWRGNPRHASGRPEGRGCCNRHQAELRDHHRQDGRSNANEEIGEGIHELSVELVCDNAQWVIISKCT